MLSIHVTITLILHSYSLSAAWLVSSVSNMTSSAPCSFMWSMLFLTSLRPTHAINTPMVFYQAPSVCSQGAPPAWQCIPSVSQCARSVSLAFPALTRCNQCISRQGRPWKCDLGTSTQSICMYISGMAPRALFQSDWWSFGGLPLSWKSWIPLCRRLIGPLWLPPLN